MTLVGALATSAALIQAGLEYAGTLYALMVAGNLNNVATDVLRSR